MPYPWVLLQAKLAASGPWGDDAEDFMAAANRAVLSVHSLSVFSLVSPFLAVLLFHSM